jgi:hypothetical protein
MLQTTLAGVANVTGSRGLAKKGFAFLLPVAICLLYLITAYKSFPVMDDGYLSLVVKERGIEGIPQYHSDRLLVGWIFFQMAHLCGRHFWLATMLMTFLLWIVLGEESVLLWQITFPEKKDYAPLIACLTVSPIVLQVQITTVASMEGLMSTVIGYFSLLLLYKWVHRGPFLLLPSALAGLAVGELLTEYTVPVAAVITVILLYQMKKTDLALSYRIRCSALSVAAVTFVSYAVYLGTSHFSRPRTNPTLVINTGLLLNFPFGLILRIWHATLGAYATAAGNFFVNMGSKSSILAAVFGCTTAATCLFLIGKAPASEPIPKRKLLMLFVALLAGLTPVTLMRPFPGSPPMYTLQNGFDSRFFIPVMPIAAVLTIASVLTIVRRQFQRVAVGILAGLCGAVVFNTCWTSYKEQQLMAKLGRSLEPYVSSGQNFTAAVLSGHEYCMVDTSCTAKATVSYSASLSRKSWICLKQEGVKLFGPRSKCSQDLEIHTAHPLVKRDGPLSNLLWIETVDYDNFSLQPYCVSRISGTTPK